MKISKVQDYIAHLTWSACHLAAVMTQALLHSPPCRLSSHPTQCNPQADTVVRAGLALLVITVVRGLLGVSPDLYEHTSL